MTTSRKECQAAQSPAHHPKSCTPRTFAEAVDCVAHHSEPRLDDIAERMGVSPNYLRKATSPNDETHPFRGDLIMPMTIATGNFAIVEFLARSVGGSFFVLPDAAPPDERQDIVGGTAKAVSEFSDVLREVSAAAADGRITHDEARRVAIEADQLIAAVAALKSLLVRKAGL